MPGYEPEFASAGMDGLRGTPETGRDVLSGQGGIGQAQVGVLLLSPQRTAVTLG